MSGDMEIAIGFGMDDLYQDYENRVHEFYSKARYYFPFCPICGNIELEIIVIIGGKDNIFCNRCGAAWHIYFSLIKEKMKWAELISPSKNGKGKEYIGKKN